MRIHIWTPEFLRLPRIVLEVHQVPTFLRFRLPVLPPYFLSRAPSWLSINATTGQVSGTPLDWFLSCDLLAANAAGRTGVWATTMTVTGALITNDADNGPYAMDVSGITSDGADSTE